RRRRDGGRWGGVERFGEGGRQHDAAVGGRPRPPGALLRRAELGDRGGAEDRGGPHRRRREGAPDLFEDEALLDDAVATAADLLRQPDAEQPGLAELVPHPLVEAVAARLDGP